jgi:hypothetical protein
MTSLTRPLGYIALAYWFLFWLLNGLDKFMHGAAVTLAGTPLFTWFGKDRAEQFGKYFDRLDLPAHGIAPLLGFCGILELGVAGLFAMALLGTRQFEAWLGGAFAACALMFISFSAWDVVVGDRAELLEHGTYLGVVFITAAFLALTKFQPVQRRTTRQNKTLGLALTS